MNKLTGRIKQTGTSIEHHARCLSEAWRFRWHLYISEKFLTLDDLFHKGFVFSIERDLTSPATRVMFNHSSRTMQQICLKMWLACNNGVYNTGGVHETKRRTQFLLEGLEFNRIFAPDIYFGIVPILSERALKYDVIECGPLIRNPEISSLDCDRPYALVMKRLDEGRRLDHQLDTRSLCNEQGMEFLALEIVAMHKQLNPSSNDTDILACLSAKLQLNRRYFHEALHQVQKAPTHYDFRMRYGDWSMDWFKSVGWLMGQVAKAHLYDFKKRYVDGHVRRCHGDLKATNLWMYPKNASHSQSFAFPGRLLPMDGVDFNPEFCHIDTLSDVAMLAVDLEMRINNLPENKNKKNRGEQLAGHFLQTYLQTTGESDDVWPMLEYYLTEKAMVCSYMSILFDNMPTLGEQYLEVVLSHSQKLVKYLPQKIDRKITKPLTFTANETTPCC